MFFELAESEMHLFKKAVPAAAPDDTINNVNNLFLAFKALSSMF